MNTLDKSLARNARSTISKKRQVMPSLPLFWRLFLSLLLLLLITSVISVTIERWINAQALEARMTSQVAHLVLVRQDVIQTLESGDYNALRQIYRKERGLRAQIIIVDEQGDPIYSRFRPSIGRGNRPSESLNNSTFSPTLPPNQMIQEVVPSADNYPELQDMAVTTLDGDTYTVQLQPRLPLQDLIALQRTHFPIRFGIILLLSLLACYWFSGALSKRIRQVQFAVHRMSAGDYRAGDDLSTLGDDELGALANDIAKLSNRLADSELARRQMLSDISHELRSPLARLEVATELTRDFAPTATRYLDRIEKESARMNELIGQIIHIQSLQMQQYSTTESEKEAVNMINLISEISQDVCFEFQDKSVALKWQHPSNEKDYLTFGNQQQLHSALENVIRNAFIHTPENSAVTIETIKIEAKHASMLQISIADEGSGIADKNIERIFEPFVRLDSARQRQTGGYGLGLAIAHAVMMAHKGQIHAYNRARHQGLVVQIELPSFIETHSNNLINETL